MAYGDIAASLARVVTTAAFGPTADQLRCPWLESVVTRPREPTAANTTPGWILGEVKQGGHGRGALGCGLGGQRSLRADSHLKEAGPPAECPTSDKGQHLVIGFLYNDFLSEIVKMFF